MLSFFLIGWEHFDECELRPGSSCWETERNISRSDTTRAQNKLWCRSTKKTQQNLRHVAP